MSILSDAWRRARGEEEEVSRALGAPPPGGPGRGGHGLPWVLSAVLLIVVVGLGVYVWRAGASRGMSGAAGAPAVPAGTVAAAAPASARARTVTRTLPAARTVAAAHAPDTAGQAGAAGKAVQQAGGAAPARGPDTAARQGVPDAVRAALPPLPVTVHVWNPAPSARFIIVRGHLYREGEDLGSGVHLVAITESGEVVRFRGYLITLTGSQ